MKWLIAVLALSLLASAVWAQNPPINLAAAANGGRIVEATSEDPPEWGAANLIDGIKGRKGWSSQLQVGAPPQDAIVDLAGDQAVLIDRVVINVETGAELLYGPYWAKDVTILISATDATELAFQPVATAALVKSGEDQTVTFNPVSARFVKLRVDSTQGGAQGNHVEVSELEVYAAGTVGAAAPVTGPIGPTAVGPLGPVGPGVGAMPTGVVPAQPMGDQGALVTAGPGVIQPGVVAQPGAVGQPGVMPEPGTTPGPVAPVGVQPAGIGVVPVVPQPGVVQPGIVQPGVVQPGIVQPGAVQPGIVQPGIVQPAVTQPAVTQPGVAVVPVAVVPVVPGPAGVGQDTAAVDAAIADVVTTMAPPVASAYGGPEVNLASQTAGGTIQASSFLNDAFGPERLNDGLKGSEDLDDYAWCSAASPAYPQDLIIEFKDREMHTVSRVVLNANTGQVDLFGERWPRDVEIYYSTDGTEDGDFHRVAEMTLKKIQEDQTIEFDPVAAKFIKVRILANHGHRKYVELAELEVWGAREPGAAGEAAPLFTDIAALPTAAAMGQPVAPVTAETGPVTGPVAVTPMAPTTVAPTAVQIPQVGEDVDIDTLILQLEDVLEQLKALKNEGG